MDQASSDDKFKKKRTLRNNSENYFILGSSCFKYHEIIISYKIHY